MILMFFWPFHTCFLVGYLSPVMAPPPPRPQFMKTSKVSLTFFCLLQEEPVCFSKAEARGSSVLVSSFNLASFRGTLWPFPSLVVGGSIPCL